MIPHREVMEAKSKQTGIRNAKGTPRTRTVIPLPLNSNKPKPLPQQGKFVRNRVVKQHLGQEK